MEKLDIFFVRTSIFFGGIGLGFALRDLGFSWVATMGFSVAFISILSVMLAILFVLDSKNSEKIFSMTFCTKTTFHSIRLL